MLTALSRRYPEVRNGFGLVLVMSLHFYPYVYLLARNAFASMGQRALEAGASAGALTPARACQSGAADGAAVDCRRRDFGADGNTG